jgi:hypothetical protein
MPLSRGGEQKHALLVGVSGGRHPWTECPLLEHWTGAIPVEHLTIARWMISLIGEN